MKTSKTVNLFKLALTIIFFGFVGILNLNAQIGLSCLPCSVEKQRIAEQQERIRAARQELPSAQAALASAGNILIGAQAALNAAIINTQIQCRVSRLSCIIARLLEYDARLALDYAQANLELRREQVRALELEIEVALLLFTRFNEDLRRCEQRSANLKNTPCLECVNGVIRAKPAGTSINTCTECDGKGGVQKKPGVKICLDGTCVPIEVKCPDLPNSVTENLDIKQSTKTFQDISISPNPVNDVAIVNMYSTSKTATPIKITLSNFQGKIVSKQEAKLNPGNNKFSVDLTKLPAGLYTLTTSSGNLIATNRIIKN